MSPEQTLSPELIAVRAHDITVSLEGTSVPDFEILSTLGMAVRLSLHLRGVQALPYTTVRNVAVYLLAIPAAAVRPILDLLAEAEFVRLDVQGRTVRTVIPNVPYYDDIFSRLTAVADPSNLSEVEWLTLTLADRLASSPLHKESAYQLGAERQLVDRVLDIGVQGSFIVEHRARGHSILLSPTYFPDTPSAYADLTAQFGSSRTSKVLNLLRQNQGWPLRLLEEKHELSGTQLDQNDLTVIKTLAGKGFIPPPAIETSHAGTNFFLFGPRPGNLHLAATGRPILEAAMALVAAVRQGQLLPRQYAIRLPDALLRALKEKGRIRANTEALQQYRQVALLKVARLEPDRGSSEWASLVLIERSENIQAIDIARDLIRGSEPSLKPQEDIVLALRRGEAYVESLIGRKRIQAAQSTLKPDEESQETLDSFLLRGAQ